MVTEQIEQPEGEVEAPPVTEPQEPSAPTIPEEVLQQAVKEYLRKAKHPELVALTPAYNRQFQQSLAKALKLSRDADAQDTLTQAQAQLKKQWEDYFSSFIPQEHQEVYRQIRGQSAGIDSKTMAQNILAKLKERFETDDNYADLELDWEEIQKEADPAKMLHGINQKALERDRKAMERALDNKIEARFKALSAKLNLAAEEPEQLPGSQVGRSRAHMTEDQYHALTPQERSAIPSAELDSLQALWLEERRTRGR